MFIADDMTLEEHTQWANFWYNNEVLEPEPQLEETGVPMYLSEEDYTEQHELLEYLLVDTGTDFEDNEIDCHYHVKEANRRAGFDVYYKLEESKEYVEVEFTGNAYKLLHEQPVAQRVPLATECFRCRKVSTIRTAA